jgi:dethiobiotin synthetase
VADLAADAGFPLLVVARLGLGTLNHVLLTLDVARARGLPVAGIVLNEAQPGTADLAAETNPDELRRRTDVPLLAVVRHGTDIGLLPPDPDLRMAVLDRWFDG